MEFRYVRWFDDLGRGDRGSVGGKNAALGELVSSLSTDGVRVPDGFAVTADAFRRFRVYNELDGLLEREKTALAEIGNSGDVGRRLRSAVLEGEVPPEVDEEIRRAYRALGERFGGDELDVAVRSSALGEDSADASFAGQLDSFLDVRGEDAVLGAYRRCCASLFTDRVIAYRAEKGLSHQEAAISVGVQKMVRSDTGSAGVAFSLDPDTGFPDVVVINAAPGFGEAVVRGETTPDQYTVFKPLLDESTAVPIVGRTRGDFAPDDRPSGRRHVLPDREIVTLSRAVCDIEEHFGVPVDVEWARDGETGQLHVVQARPETVHSKDEAPVLARYRLAEEGDVLVEGVAVGSQIASGVVRRVLSVEESDRVRDGDILVTPNTDPDWVPIMRRVSAIVTDTGGRTCHAAIVSRELGVPAIVGTGSATGLLEDGQEVTVVCSDGATGRVHRGLLDFDVERMDLSDPPATRTDVMLNVGSPEAAFRWWKLPTDGVGLARMEFVITNEIRVHPMALVRFSEIDDPELRATIERMTAGYEVKTEYFVDRLAEGIATLACAHWPNPVIVRMSDFKTNEYADLVGGRLFERPESNPMLGFRGAARYYSDRYRPAFELECEAVRRVREECGLTNVRIMVPFCRTVAEADRVLEILEENGVGRGDSGLEVYMMAEVPSNVVLADAFAERFDGFSIGSNDLTQLVLGVDRDAADLADLFDERDEAVKTEIGRIISAARRHGIKVGICGQGPSDHPELADFLVRAGIDSVSLNPDSVVDGRRQVAAIEAEIAAGREAEYARRALSADGAPARR
mgnify:CR=1 FL=1